MLDETDICPVLGIPLKSGRGKGSKAASPDSPSFDRFVPRLGYVPGNVVVMSWRANRMKYDATLDELVAVATWMAERADAAAIDAQHAFENEDGTPMELM